MEGGVGLCVPVVASRGLSETIDVCVGEKKKLLYFHVVFGHESIGIFKAFM